MNFFCFSFALNQKYRAANVSPLIAAKSGRKKAPAKTGPEITVATQIIKKLRSVEEKGLLMQYHSINIEKLPKRKKNKVSSIPY